MSNDEIGMTGGTRRNLVGLCEDGLLETLPLGEPDLRKRLPLNRV